MAEQIVQPHQLATGTRDGSHFLRDDGTWAIPAGTGGGGSGSSGGSGSGALVPIQVIGPLTAAQANLSFSSIPQTGFRNLKVVVEARSAAGATPRLIAQINGDSTTANYDHQTIAGAATTASASNAVGSFAGMYLGDLTSTGSTAARAAIASIDFVDYAGTTFNKTAFSRVAQTALTEVVSATWHSTNAITSIVFSIAGTSGNFDVGSYACLYGEMDTAGALLTPASNLLFESVLASSAASISTGVLSQAYRDLRIVIQARGDTASTSTLLEMQINGDTGSNYDSGASFSSATAGQNVSAATTFAQIGEIAANSAPSGSADTAVVTIPNYASSVFRKTGVFQGSISRSDTPSGNNFEEFGRFIWRNTSAISSLVIFPAAGNLVAGSSIRIYGEPATTGAASVGTGTRLRISTNQTITHSAATPVAWDVEDTDADNQHYTSAANLTGTVAKTAASQTLTGTSTLFTSELSIGQVISVPGTAAEVRVVIAIASNTSLTVGTAFMNTATAQTAQRVNSAVVFRQPGFYALDASIFYPDDATTSTVTLQIRLNGSTIVAQQDYLTGGPPSVYTLSAQRQFQQWDYVELLWTYTTASSLPITADERTHFAISSRPTVIVAIPYINIQDQKTSGTAGGGFTSGADQTRTLNTIDSDTAGVSTLASNQITLPSGTYRASIYCPAISVGAHQALLYNVTDAVVIKRGKTMQASTGDGTGNDSIIKTKFVLNGTKVLEVRHRCTTTKTTDGFGVAASFGTEVYTVAEFWKEG